MIREICKAGWLQQKIEKRTGAAKWTKNPKTIFLPEKWYVLCVHDDRTPFLEVYSSDEGVNRHEPLETLNLNECQYITTAIEDDRSFVIAFQNEGRSSLELAALSALERREWMEMLRFKLTRLGCLESGSNIYTPFPVTSSALVASTVTTETDNTASVVQSFSLSNSIEESVDHTYEPPRRSIVAESVTVGEASDMAPPISHLTLEESIYEPISHVSRPRSESPAVAEANAAERDDFEPATPPSYSVIRKDEKPQLPPRNGHGAAWSSLSPSLDISHRRRGSNSEAESTCALYDIPRAIFPSLDTLASSPPKPPPVVPKPSIERYDPLPLDRDVFRRSTEESVMVALGSADADGLNGAPALIPDGLLKNGNNTVSKLHSSSSFDNPGFDEDEDASRRYANGPLLSSPESSLWTEPDQRGPYSALPGRPRMVPWSVLNTQSTSSSTSVSRAHSNSPLADSTAGRSRSHSVATTDQSPSVVVAAAPIVHRESLVSRTPSPPTSPPPAPPLPLPNAFTLPVGSGRVMPLKETEVERLRSEMETPLLVKASNLRLEHLVGENGHLTGLAVVDMMGYVWIAGWLRRFAKQFSACLHVGDRLDSILDADGKAVAISSVAKVEQVLKELLRRGFVQVTLFIKRLPLGQVYILKRAANGDNVGIVLKNGKNEILAIEEGKPASRAGMRAQCKSSMSNSDTMVNYFLTEVNGRPLNMFAKENEAQKRLNAVGTEITVLVQPSDFVKELRKKLKHRKGYKDYVIG